MQCINEILDIVCKTKISIYSYGHNFQLINNSPSSFRIKNEEDNNDCTNIATGCSTDSDSDEEFNRIMVASRRMRPKEVYVDYDDDCDDESFHANRRTEERFIEKEYDKLPAVEQISFHVNNDVKLQKLGKVVQVVDCLVVVQCDSDVALDVDSVLFDEDRVAVGQVFDIFGAIANPLYSIRFNTPEDAKKCFIGMNIYFAPSVDEYTRTVFTEQLKNLKITDSCWDGVGECPDDQLAFSDDEEEKRYMAKKRRVRHRSSKQVFNHLEKRKPESSCNSKWLNRSANYYPERGRLHFYDDGIRPVRFTNNFTPHDTTIDSQLTYTQKTFPSRARSQKICRYNSHAGSYSYGSNFASSSVPYGFGQKLPFSHIRDTSQINADSACHSHRPDVSHISSTAESLTCKDQNDMDAIPMIIDTRLVENEAFMKDQK